MTDCKLCGHDYTVHDVDSKVSGGMACRKCPEGACLPGGKLTIEGNDNYGKPRQDFADKLAKASDEEYLGIAEEYIWLSAYASNNSRSDYHWKADACYDEAKRRGKPELYGRAHKMASGTM